MASSATVWGRVRSLVAPLSADERLELIRAIAAMEPVPEPDGSGSRRAQLDRELAAWSALPATQRAAYLGEFVAVHDGQVVDHTSDQRSLYLRVRSRYGNTPVLIVPADWTESPVYVVDSPRLEQ